ncbi:MAG: hypothetical protein HQM13_13270, partial [SAR324 cluster bacterium]|nr:hypothetical protein [SAR324 cluster bacterium]
MSIWIKDWWASKKIRTKFLLSIFLGLVLYQGVTTTYQINNARQQIIDKYRAKALTISYIVDCIVLKDNELLFNLLERSGETEIKQITVDSNHPSCVDRHIFIQRLKTLHFEEFEKKQQTKVSLNETGNTEEVEEV